MIKTRLRKLDTFTLLLMLGFICIFYSGCSEPTASGSKSDVDSDKSELDYQAQDNRPPTAKTLFSMAEILAAQGKDSECEYILNRIIREDPAFLPAYNSMAELQLRKGQTNAAIETLQQAHNLNSKDPVLLNNLGMCWIIRRDYENALKMFTLAAAIMPENVRYRANMAVALGLMGRDEESLALFRQVLPKDQASHNLRLLQEARNSEKPVSETISKFQSQQSHKVTN